MKSKIIKIIVYVIFITNANCQEIKKVNYYIISCEKIGKYDENDGGDLFYWIIPCDSVVNVNDYQIYPLYLEGFSKRNKFNCIDKKSNDIFTSTTADDYDLSEKESNDLKTIKKIIFNKSRLFFTSIKKWDKGTIAKMKFSIVPVSGNFCYSLISKESGKRINYFGNIYLALSNFKYEPNFINSKSYNEIIKVDFGSFNVYNE